MFQKDLVQLYLGKKEIEEMGFTNLNAVIFLWIHCEQGCEDTDEVNIIFFTNPEYPQHVHIVLQVAGELSWCQFIFALV